ncbi:MAG: DUF87 domain-containing protein [Nanoarchaeota archaeon]|nr:DUF87 domain-containing protein [Nanoarchaeota archaeon]
MSIGSIIGKTTTMDFKFKVEKNAKKFQYLRVPFKNGDVLAQILEIEKNLDETVAYCIILGFKRENKDLEPLLVPLEPGNKVLDADDNFVKESLGLEKEKGAFVGTLDGRSNLKVFLDLNKILTKHICILAKSGSGKCINPKTKILLGDGSYETIGRIVDDKLREHCHIEEDVEISRKNSDCLKVFALDKKNSIVKTKINAFMRRKYNRNLILIKTRTGKEIEVTEEHKIPILEECILWRSANHLRKGNFLLIPKPEIIGKNQIIDIVDLCKDDYNLKVKNDKINKIIIEKIYSSGTNLKKFSCYFDVNYSGFRKWFNGSGIPLKELIKICKLLDLDFKEIKKKINFLSSYLKKIPSFIKVDKDFSRLLAYFLSEGHNNGKIMTFTNSCLKIQKEFAKLFKKIFYYPVSKTKYNEVRIYNCALSNIFQKLGFTNSSWTKFIPKEITTSKKEVLASFLSCFIDCDGHVSKNKPNLEINLASKKLIGSIENMFMRFNIVPVKTNKKINGRLYPKLIVYGSKNLKVLNALLDFKIKHKKERLNYFSRFESNPNIEIVPNISENLKRIFTILNMHESESVVNCHWSYTKGKKCPSFDTLKILLNDLEKKYFFIKDNIERATNIYENLPKINEEYALDYIKKCHSEGISFQEISRGINISGSTAGRMVRGNTKLTNNVYTLAKSSLELMELEDIRITNVSYINLLNTLKNIREICFNLGYKISSLCLEEGHYKGFIYRTLKNNKSILYSDLFKFGKKLKEISLKKQEELPEVEHRIAFLKSLSKEHLFFDEIVSIKMKKHIGYVYDLETEEHNFIANNIIIHNSYSAGVLLEEILEEKIPLLIIDPHAEYSSMKKPNNEEKERLGEKGLLPKGYGNVIQEYSPDTTINSECIALKLSSKSLTPNMLVHLLPAKLSNAQLGILYSALQNSKDIDFDELMLNIDAEDNNLKYTVLNIIDYLKKLEIFSENPTALQELIQPGKASIINLKGIPTEVSEIVVYKLLKDLFEARKRGNVPPFFLVVEEAHNYCPERGFGEAKSSNVLRQIASEGRKFGLGLCIISQRPARVDKNVLSQITTQIILKVTNPNDLKAISASVEGITAETEKEIRNIPIGTAMIVGVVNQPLIVNIRPRRSKHGGTAIDILGSIRKEKKVDFMDEMKKYDGGMLLVIKQKNTIDDIKLMSERKIKEIKTRLVPCSFLRLKKDNEEFNILVNLYNNEVIVDCEKLIGIKLPAIDKISQSHLSVLKIAVNFGKFSPAQLFEKSKLQFSEVYDVINSLTGKGYFVKNDSFELSKSLEILAKLKESKCFEKPDFVRMKFDEKINKNFENNEIVKLVSNFFEVLESKECWLETFKIEFEKEKED